jgi:Trk K+ transport system NAD-binding subunit
VAGRTLYAARRKDVSPKRTVCALAMTQDPVSPQLLPPDTASADLVLAIADGTARNPLAKQRRHPVRGVIQQVRALLWHRLGLVFIALFAVLAIGFALLATAAGFSLWNAAYLTGLDAAGAAQSVPQYSAPEKIAQILLTFDGLTLLPVLTAVVVGARLTGSLQRHERPLNDHVIVVGLGNVGTRIVGQLHDLGVSVACVDKSETAAGIALARRLGLRVVIGATDREDTLRAAGIRTCQALVSVTDSDIVNLETALLARSLAEDIRIVLRLGDEDLAGRVQRSVGNTISRSVPYLAAPSFALAMLEHQVLRTIAVGRHVLLVADLSVGAGSQLDGSPVEQVHQNGLVRVLAVQRPGGGAVDWSPSGDLQLAARDRLYVIATRAGLSRVLAGSQVPRG